MARPTDLPDEALVVAVRDGDRDAFAELFVRWFDRVYDVARNIVRSPDTAAEVAQDTFIAAWGAIGKLERPEAFGGWLLRIARNRALDRLRREGRSRPHEESVVTALSDGGALDPTMPSAPADPAELAVERDRDGLIHAVATVLGERDASLLDLQLRHGLTPAEIADELGVSANSAHQMLFRLRKRLGAAIGAFVLWRHGRPECEALAAQLGAGTSFDLATYEAVERHQEACDACRRRRAVLVAPEQLFTALPLVAVPLAVRTRVMDALRDAGVPIPPAEPANSRHGRHRRGAALLVAAAVVVVIAAVALWAGGRDGSPRVSGPIPTGSGQPRSATSIPATGQGVVSVVATPAPSSVPTSTIGPTVGRTTVVRTTSARTTPTSPPTLTSPPSPTTARPSTTRPVPLATVVRTSAPPPTTATAATTSAPAPPQIVRFVVVGGPSGLLCSSGTPRRFTWSSVRGASASLVVSTSRTVPVSGTADVCASSGAVAKLVVTGAGGTVERTLAVP